MGVAKRGAAEFVVGIMDEGIDWMGVMIGMGEIGCRLGDGGWGWRDLVHDGGGISGSDLSHWG